MPGPEGRRATKPDQGRPAPWLRVGLHATVALSAFLWAIVGIDGISADATAQRAVAGHQTQAGSAASITTGQKGVVVHDRKEGPLAVAFSVLGVVVVVVFVVGLGSLSARRRSRHGPHVARRGPTDRWRRPSG